MVLGDETTRLVLEMNAFSANDGKLLTLKENMCGARDELTHLVIKTITFGTTDERVWRWRQTINPNSSNLPCS